MGFRSVFITEDWAEEIPQWFVAKYPHLAYGNFDNKPNFPIAQLFESKFYGPFAKDERWLDIQRIIKESEDLDAVTIILLHECGGVTRIQITKDAIIGQEPTEWRRVDGVTHNYCYGCSDI